MPFLYILFRSDEILKGLGLGDTKDLEIVSFFRDVGHLNDIEKFFSPEKSNRIMR
jgi:hypothetical protein